MKIRCFRYKPHEHLALSYWFVCEDGRAYGLQISWGIIRSFSQAGMLFRQLRPILRVQKEKMREGTFQGTTVPLVELLGDKK
jgi:hypothetical protein